MTDPDHLTELEHIAAERLSALVARSLARADDALFDLSQNGDGAEQAGYFEAMRQLRRSRATIETGWRMALKQRFRSLRGPAGGEPAPTAAALSLVDADVLEEQLACEHAAATLDRLQADPIARYRAGLARALRRPQIEAGDDPLSTLALTTSFRDLLMPEVSELRARLVILKWLERHLIDDFGAVLDASVRRLAERGVSVELPPRHAPAAAAGHAAAQQAAGQHPPASAAGQGGSSGGWAGSGDGSGDTESLALYKMMCGLFASYLGSTGADAGAAAGARAPGQAGPGRPRLPTAVVLALLGRMQGESQPVLLRAVREGQRELGAVVRDQVVERAMRERAAPTGVSLLDRDEQGLMLVGMLFDVLLDQGRFSDEIRQRLSLLVFPYARVALSDQRVFAHKAHPARRLLNALAEACDGNTGDTAADRDILQHATTTIDRVLAVQGADTDEFTRLEEQLRAHLEQRARRSAVAERRSTETQRGRERLDEARRDAEMELASLVAGRPAPRAIAEFLRSNWTHHLTMVALREGVDSDAYRRARAAGVSLWLAMLACESGAAVPDSLDQTLSPVLSSGGMDAEAARPVLSGIRTALASLRPGPRPAAAPIPAGEEDPATPLEVISADPDHAPATLKSEIAGDADSLRLSLGDASPCSEALQAVRAMQAGTWVDIVDDDGALHAAKLSWVSPISERRLFVNRRGLRLCTLSPEEMAVLSGLDRLRVHAAATPVERALTDVVSRAQQRAAVSERMSA
jgi:hypothetical protein